MIKVLGGGGTFFSWISVALCIAACGSVGPTLAGVTVPCPGPPFAAADTPPGWVVGAPAVAGAAGVPGAAGATGGGWLMTLLITVVLWILAKMMLFGGGAT